MKKTSNNISHVVDAPEFDVSYKYIFEELNKGYVLIEVLYSNDDHPYDIRIYDVNKIVENFTGNSLASFKGKRFSEIYKEIDVEWLNSFDASLKSKTSMHFHQYSPVFKRDLKTTLIPAKENFLMILLEDNTSLKRTENSNKKYLKDLETFNEKLKLANKKLADRQTKLEDAYYRIKESEERWMFALEGGSRAVFDYDFVSKKVFYSQAWDTLFGHSADELNQRNELWFDLIYEADRENLYKSFDKYINGEEDEFFEEARLKKRDGSLCWVVIKGKILKYLSNEKPERIIGTFTDITKRKKTEQALIISEARLKEAQDLANQGYWSLNLSSGNLDWSDQIFKILDYEVGELDMSLENFRKHIHPEDRYITEKTFQEITETNTNSYTISYRIITRKNRLKYINEVCRAHTNKANKTISLLGTIQDITKLRTIEEEFRKTKRRFDVLFESADDRIALFTSTGDLIYNNSSFFKAIGYSEIEYLEKFSKDKYESNFMMSGVFSELSENGTATREYKILNKEGNTQYMYAKYVCIDPNKEGKFDHILAIIRDVTQYKVNEYELTIAKEKAVESDQLKSAFLANMSHEIRTPLNGILGFVKLILKKDLPDKKKNYYSGLIDTNARQLLSIISDILDVAKIESGQLTINYEPFNLNKCMDDLYVNYKEMISYKKLGLRLEVVKGLKDEMAIIVSDNLRLIQILKNLLNNALKFTQKGTVRFGYELSADKIRFFVVDSGIGISDDKKKVIFDRFRQEDDSVTRDFGGTGLGLTISRQLVKMLKGDIWLESEKNNGTTFYFELPYLQ